MFTHGTTGLAGTDNERVHGFNWHGTVLFPIRASLLALLAAVVHVPGIENYVFVLQ